MKTAKQIRITIEAEYKARSIYADLLEMSEGDPKLLIEGLNTAMMVIKNDLVNLLPLPAKPAADPAAPPAGEGQQPPLDLSKLPRHQRRAIEAVSKKGKKAETPPAANEGDKPNGETANT